MISTEIFFKIDLNFTLPKNSNPKNEIGKIAFSLYASLKGGARPSEGKIVKNIGTVNKNEVMISCCFAVFMSYFNFSIVGYAVARPQIRGRKLNELDVVNKKPM